MPLITCSTSCASLANRLRLGLGWVVRPPAAGGETIYDAYMREAGTTGRTEAEIARLQRWRREHNVMWVSEMFRADGINATRPLHDEPGSARTAVRAGRHRHRDIAFAHRAQNDPCD